MNRTRIPQTVAVPLAGLLAVILAAAGTAWTGSAAEDNGEPKSTDPDSGSVSHSVSQSEAEDAAHYWTPERMRNAKPG